MFKTENLPYLTMAKAHRWVLLAFSCTLILSNAMFAHAQTTERAKSVMVGAPGVDSTCAVTTTGGLKCWGANGLVLSNPVSTSLGTVDRAINVLRPSDVVGLTSGVASATHFSASNQCITDTDGLLKCKGANSVGQIGIGTTSLYESLRTVPGLNGTPSVAMGATHVCAVTAAGGVKCWGNNANGRLGDNTATNRSAPVDVVGLTSGVASVSNASDHSCAVTTTGGVKCWGNNFFGKLGDGTNTERRTPVDVVGLTSGVAAVAVGGSHTCALTTGGGVKCWGLNFSGTLGDDTITERRTPVDVVGLSSGVSAISAGSFHTCALTTSGGIRCWGRNAEGQLGDNTTTQRNAPVDVVGLTSGVTQVSANTGNTCAVTTGGGVKCWGSNSFGQIGDGTTTSRTAPVDVLGFAAGTTPPVATAPLNYTDMWWGGQAENGWGMAITQHSPSNQQFNAFYVYEANGQPTWYVMPGGTWSNNFTVFAGLLYRPTGPRVDNFVATNIAVGASVGSATLTFTSAGTATFAYTINGVSASKNIQRQTFGAADNTPGLQVGDLWWGGNSQNGWGITLAQQSRTLFGVWYTYGSTCSGSNSGCVATWHVMPGGSWGTGANANTYIGSLYATTGSPWLGTTYNAGSLNVTLVGTVSITFTPDIAGSATGLSSNASMTYTFTAGPFAGTSQTKPIVRQLF